MGQAEWFPEQKHGDLDVLVVNHGSLALVHLHSERAQAWVQEHVDPDAIRFGGNLVVELRYLADLVDGMALDGLKVN